MSAKSTGVSAVDHHDLRASIWQSPDVQEWIDDIWETNAPPSLRHLIILFLAKEKPEITYEQGIQALIWGNQNLNSAWNDRFLELADKLQKYYPDQSSDYIQRQNEKPWRQMLRLWPQFSFQYDGLPSWPPAIQTMIQELGLSRNPFGSEKAEADPLLLQSFTSIDLYQKLAAPRSIWINGARGSGKTAACLLACYNGLKSNSYFPVYYRAAEGFGLQEAAAAQARALLSYIAVRPLAFLRVDIAHQASIAHLIGFYIARGSALTLRLSELGLSRSGSGQQVREQMLELTASLEGQSAAPNDNDLLGLMQQSAPYGFPYVNYLIDLQPGFGSNEKDAAYLVHMIRQMSGAGLTGRFFAPVGLEGVANYLAEYIGVETVRLEWSEADLNHLLSRRLNLIGEDSIGSWLPPGPRSQWGGEDPNHKLIELSGGTPGGLIRSGNRLMTLIGRIGRKHLKMNDLNLLEQDQNGG
jgi:hypothetical protein